MKRWTIRVVVFLLLGAIVNVAVAWGCAARGGSGSGIIVEFAESSIRQGGFWLVRTESARGAQRVHSNRLVDSLDGWTRSCPASLRSCIQSQPGLSSTVEER